MVAYVRRDRRIVAFLHESDRNPVLDSGLQVPAGTVERGESPEIAVLREAREETGLQGLELVRHLGTDYPHWPGVRPQVRQFFELTVGAAPEVWSHVERDGHASGPGHHLNLFWIPIEKAALLAAGQGMFVSKLLDEEGTA